MSSKRIVLGYKEINNLIDVWKEHTDELRGVHRNKHVYQAMSTQLDKEYGIPLNPSEIRSRLNNLTKKYRVEKAKTCKSGSSPSQWQYYEQVHNVIGAYKCINLKEQEDDKSWFTDDQVIEENAYIVDELASPHSYELSIESPVSQCTSLPSDNIPGPSSAKKRKTKNELVEVLQKDQQIMEHFLKKTLENDKKTISLLEENNKLLAKILKK